MEIYEMTALEIAQKIKNREISCEDAVLSVAKSIEEKDGTYNCYTSFDRETALEKAKAAQKLIDSGSAVSPLVGVPVVLGDEPGVA